jgi:hypothetical protein
MNYELLLICSNLRNSTVFNLGCFLNTDGPPHDHHAHFNDPAPASELVDPSLTNTFFYKPKAEIRQYDTVARAHPLPPLQWRRRSRIADTYSYVRITAANHPLLPSDVKQRRASSGNILRRLEASFRTLERSVEPLLELQM